MSKSMLLYFIVFGASSYKKEKPIEKQNINSFSHYNRDQYVISFVGLSYTIDTIPFNSVFATIVVGTKVMESKIQI